MLLADKSLDLSQPEKEVTVSKAEKTQRITMIFNQNIFLTILCENNCHFVNLLRFDNSLYFLKKKFQLEINHAIYQPAQSGVDHLMFGSSYIRNVLIGIIY